MKKICGDLDLMSLPDLLQWVEMNQRTGTLSFGYQGEMRSLYFENGKIIFVSSQASGDRLGDFLVNSGLINDRQFEEALSQSQKLKTPFTSQLITEQIVNKDVLEQVISKFAETIIANALKREGGGFEFSDIIPESIINGPIKLNTSFLIFESLRIIDESIKYKKAG